MHIFLIYNFIGGNIFVCIVVNFILILQLCSREIVVTTGKKKFGIQYAGCQLKLS